MTERDLLEIPLARSIYIDVERVGEGGGCAANYGGETTRKNPEKHTRRILAYVLKAVAVARFGDVFV